MTWTSRLRFGIAFVVCGGLVALPGLTASAEQRSSSSQKSDTATGLWEDLSDEERMSAAQDQILVADQLEERFGHYPGYGLGKFERDFETLTLSWAGEVPTELEQFISERPQGITVNLRSAPYTLAELNAEARRLFDEAEAAGLDLTGVSVPTEMTHLEIYFNPGEGANRAADLKPRIPVTVGERGHTVPLIGRQDDEPPFRGGASWRSRRTGGLCTTGFTVLQGGDRRMLTAEHCEEQEGVRADTRTLTYNIGLTGHGNKDLDAMVIRGRSYHPAVYTGKWNSALRKGVHGRRNPWRDEPVTVSGAFSGAQFGRVLDEHDFDDGIGPGFVIGTGSDSHRGLAGHGDSGGPVFVHRDDNGQVSARGIIQGGRSGKVGNCQQQGISPCFYRIFAIKILAIENGLNLQVVS